MILLVIDMQKALLVDELYNHQALLNNVAKLIKSARKNNKEVIFIQHDAGPGTGFSKGDPGFEIANKIKPLANEKVFTKKINSCFGNIDFATYLEQSHTKELMIVGLQTDFCVDATIKSAFEKGYQVIVPCCANSTFTNQFMDGKTTHDFYNKWIWPDTFARCVSMKEATELLEKN